MTAEIDPIAGAEVNAKLTYPFADRFTVPEIPGFDAKQANPDASLSRLIPKSGQPLGDRLAALFTLISNKLHQRCL